MPGAYGCTYRARPARSPPSGGRRPDRAPARAGAGGRRPRRTPPPKGWRSEPACPCGGTSPLLRQGLALGALPGGARPRLVADHVGNVGVAGAVLVRLVDGHEKGLLGPLAGLDEPGELPRQGGPLVRREAHAAPSWRSRPVTLGRTSSFLQRSTPSVTPSA